ncbi:hypothetical protein DSL92_08300 [Billgrantia gudaonensis]|uniref:Uncharacterized protein n=1 Tax=Billgrantia gudaonensis TaxID=376427 RepID=A0A432JIB4_9GAMM|nr:hypothetical protein DSL92_08300 [Halomonas gudaonensis]
MQWFLNKKILFFITLASLILIPIGVGDDYIYHIFITICLFAGLSTAWNIVGGYAGQLARHAIYYGIGAHGNADAQRGRFSLISMFVGAILAAGWRSPSATLLQAAWTVLCACLHCFSGGLSCHFAELGRPDGRCQWRDGALEMGWSTMIFTERLPSLVIVFGLMSFALAVAWAIRRSKLGFQLIATRGVGRQGACDSHRACAVVCGGDFRRPHGHARTFHGSYLTFIEPESAFNLTFSIQIVLFALVGGWALFSALSTARFCWCPSRSWRAAGWAPVPSVCMGSCTGSCWSWWCCSCRMAS